MSTENDKTNPPPQIPEPHFYAVELEARCIGFGETAGECLKKASVEVFNTNHASMGKFCRQCATRAIKKWKWDRNG